MITLYSTGCPNCKVLISKLDEKDMPYSIVDDVELMLSMGLTTVPVLEVNGEKMNFNQAFAWVCEQKGHNDEEQ